MIQLNNITKVFPEVLAVDNVSFHIKKGEIYGIIGFSGAGKSSLIRCINMLEPPTSGTVIVEGIPMGELSPRALREKRKKIGMIFQHFNLLPSRTVFENIAYPLEKKGLSKAEIRSKIVKLLAVVEISDKIFAYPSELSGGQKQRVAIARALVNDPHILLCDEATSALDPKTSMAILRLLKRLNQEIGITIVLITHEMNIVKEICNRVAVMDHGRVVEEGEVYDIFSNPIETITKDFIATTSSLNKVYELIESKSPVVALTENEKILKLTYTNAEVHKPLVATVSRQYNVSLSIIFSDVSVLNSAPLGGIIAIATGKENDIKMAVAFLKENSVRVEVIK